MIYRLKIAVEHVPGGFIQTNFISAKAAVRAHPAAARALADELNRELAKLAPDPSQLSLFGSEQVSGNPSEIS